METKGELSTSLAPEIIIERKRKIAWVARVFSRTYNLTIVPSKGGGWAAGLDNEYLQEIEKFITGKRESLEDVPNKAFHPTQIQYDETEVATKPEDEIMGVLRHEVGHVNHSNYKLIIEGQRWAQEQGALPSTYIMSINYPEDVWVNIREIEDSTVVEQQMKARYTASVAEVLPHVPTQLITHQLGLNIIYYWLTGNNLPTLEDKRVLTAFEQIKLALEEYFYGATTADNDKLFREKIWPTFKAMEAQAQKDEAKDQIKQNLQKNQGQGAGNPGQEAAQSLPQDLKRELEKSLPGELTPEQEAGLEKAIDSLPEDLKKRLMAKAREQLDQKQAKALDEDLPKFLKMKKDEETGEFKAHIQAANPKDGERKAKDLEQFLTGEETKELERLAQEAAADQARESQQRRQEQEQQKKVEMKRAGFNEKEVELYQRFKQLEAEILPHAQRFIAMIDPYIPKKYKVIRTGHYITGSRPDPREAARRIPVKDYRILRRKEIVDLPEALLYATLLIDNSGSMAGPKMDSAIRTGIFFATVFRHYNMPFSVKLFGDRTAQVMGFGQDYDDPKYHIKRNFITLTDARGKSTNLDEGMTKALEELEETQRLYPESFGAIFTISDGQANAGRTGQLLKDFIESKRARKILKAFALGGSKLEQEKLQKDLAFYFGGENVAVPELFADLPQSAFHALRATLTYVSRMRQV